MKKREVAQFILIILVLALILFFIPIQKVVLFKEQKTNRPSSYYAPITESDEFQIRYVHSIHKTDVIETYEVTHDKEIRFISMKYENIGIGLPGSAGDGEKFSFSDGRYALTYDDYVIDSFTLFIATIDTDLAFRYCEKEYDLKEKLEKGKSYKISIEKLSIYQMLRGVNLYAERSKEKR